MKTLLAIAVLILPAYSQKPSVRVSADHQIQIKFSNAQCKNDTSCRSISGVPSAIKNCLCDAFVYRASCSSAITCPDPNKNPGSYTQLSPVGNLTYTTDTTGTSWTYTDVDTALVDGSTWSYAVRNNWSDQTNVTNPSSMVAATPVTIPKVNTVHQAVLNFTSGACTNATPCWFQLYKASCTSATNCPTFSPGNTAFKALMNATFPIWNETTTGTTWQIVDDGTDSPFAANATYTYVGTVCWAKTCQAYSPASAPWSGTTTTRGAK